MFYTLYYLIIYSITISLGLKMKFNNKFLKLKLILSKNKRLGRGSQGQIKGLGIAKSSGYPLPDEAVMPIVNKASPYPSPEYC